MSKEEMKIPNSLLKEPKYKSKEEFNLTHLFYFVVIKPNEKNKKLLKDLTV
jgi:hypothetical protein